MPNMLKNLSISLRIFLAIFLFNVLGMVATILFTTLHFKSTSEKYHEERLLRKEERVLETFDYFINEKEVTEEELPRLMKEYVNEISDLNNLDINIYDNRGNLITSNLGDHHRSVSQKMPSEIVAKVLLRDERVEIDSLVKDSNNETSYYKIHSYNSFKNNNQETLAIINIPYVDNNSFLKEEFNNLLKGLLGIIAILILGSSILAWVISKTITRKVKNLANTLSSKDAFFENQPIDYNQNDEIKPLVDSYNQVLEKFKNQSNQLALIEREEAWREMAKQVAHEIKNPLTPMRLMIQKYQMNFNQEDPKLEENTKELTKTLLQQIDLLTSITDAFSDFAKMPNKQEEEINITETIDDALDLFNKEWVFYRFDNPAIIAVMDRIYLTRIITNLVKNALQAIEDSAKKVEVELKDLEDEYLIKVSDNGNGIPTAIQAKIFEPKFTTKNAGMGLGLAMVKKIVEDYKGRIWFVSNNQGTTFYIQISKFGN